MGNIEKVDARGLSCPEPVILAEKAMKKVKKGKIEVWADSGTARDNIARLAKNNGWQVAISAPEKEEYCLILTK
jgi:TusA-related sulfurtransferase